MSAGGCMDVLGVECEMKLITRPKPTKPKPVADDEESRENAGGDC